MATPAHRLMATDHRATSFLLLTRFSLWLPIQNFVRSVNNVLFFPIQIFGQVVKLLHYRQSLCDCHGIATFGCNFQAFPFGQ